jgi:pimeloyl-ACP methyl ester carboxylesterase
MSSVTVVLVHGNPETDVVWDSLIDALAHNDVVRLSPPGFGAPLPSGFSATYIGYRDWLIDELQRIGQPIDLVGHDWGGLHVVNAVMHRADLVRSWASDTVGMFDADYVWHDMAQVFQTPEAGEQVVETMVAGPAQERAQQLADFGIPAQVASSFAAAQGPDMARAILEVYRSARQPALADAGRQLANAAARPGLSIVATEDPFVGTDDMRRRAAERAGARTEVLDGLGHWWMVEDPGHAAAALTRFWESVGG